MGIFDLALRIIDFAGFNGFTSNPIQVHSADVIGGEPGILHLNLNITIPNYSSLEMSIGDTVYMPHYFID